ncbi:hypothetical protein K488DRAFT_68991 [Vararia minispora EC-137]|uniref:Uncharacterized protein n=1 Tax=Vararia minispora EC-137 TaxID=1314806 RepID=A0ACB8QSF7_9AGAM|nr:hypothetical protein K488DRAFT_68991 [Vararia minispora EC-137]
MRARTGIAQHFVITTGAMKGKKRGRAISDDELEYEGPPASSASTASAGTLKGRTDDELSVLEESPSMASSSALLSSEVPDDTPSSAADADEALSVPANDGQEDIGTPTEAGPITRIRSLAVYVDDEMAVYAPRKVPNGLRWNSSSVKNSKLVLPGTDTTVSLWIVGQVNWNGMIPSSSSTGSPGVAYISIDPLVEGDLSKLRDLVTRYSSNGSTADAMKSVRASRMMSYRERNNPDMQVQTFSRVFDARDGKVAICDMDYLDPSFVMQRDIVLVEVSLGRFRDSKTKDWTKFRLSLELDAVYVLAQAPKPATDERSLVKRMRYVI